MQVQTVVLVRAPVYITPVYMEDGFMVRRTSMVKWESRDGGAVLSFYDNPLLRIKSVTKRAI